MTHPLHERTPWSVHVTRVIAVWILAGAVMKLLWGSASDLPKLIRSLPLDPLVLFRVAPTDPPYGPPLPLRCPGQARACWGAAGTLLGAGARLDPKETAAA